MKITAYIQAIKDDFCLFEVCKRLADEGLQSFVFCVPDEYWDGKPTSEADKQEVLAVANKLQALGVSVSAMTIGVGKYRHPRRSRIEVETLVRNESLYHVRQLGFEHIIILDGDELWRPGIYTNLVASIKHHAPQAVSMDMIPTIGLPGYPVDGATDLATIYVGPGVYFESCRGPRCDNHAVIRGVHGIYHFTATRKTMAEIIAKHRGSGHYDDPAYDFEGWIANVLPNVRPGMRNLHMYVPYQIWPVAREWTQREWASMPESIRPYLAQPTHDSNSSISTTEPSSH